mmetsp:Transcript_24785/g.41291  ORF Transcript_24785/g.41291 Transcript_24785/m.41291 type:complete len:904 (-) Transcript_24785:1746-4457(-)
MEKKMKIMFEDEDMKEAEVTAERDWNTHDFMGMYHFGRFTNQKTPVPGTQVSIERGYLEGLEKREKDRADVVDANIKRAREKLRVKTESAQLNTRIYFDTIVGVPMDSAEEILYERDDILHDPHIAQDSAKDIKRYLKNLSLGRHHYVGFAASSGFKSINYQEETWGNTALHLAVKNGHVAATEELLKYKADFDIINNLGNRPVHEAWFFWKTHANRTKEERESQEQTTCDLLLKLFSYGAFVDGQDQQGNTPLHIACRLGPTKAVKVILSFKADCNIRNNANQTPADVAVQYGQEESYRLIASWTLVAHELVRLDFHVIWRKFLQDYEAVISTHKSAETILGEIGMSSSVRKMQIGGDKNQVRIEDPLLLSAYEQAKLTNPKPKPWEKDWKSFVRLSEASGVLDLKSELENLEKQRMGLKTKKKGGAAAKKLFRVKRDAATADKPTPTPRPRLLQSMKSTNANTDTNTNTNASVSSGSSNIMITTTTQLPQLQNKSGSLGAQGQDIGTMSGTASSTGVIEGDRVGIEGVDEEEEEDNEDLYNVVKTDYGHIQDFRASTLGQRRLRLAEKVALDAKFLKFTKRFTTDSALMIPLRTPQAPLDGTAEENDEIRRIVAQGPDYDKFRKYKVHDTFAEMVGLRHAPPTSTIGAYTQELGSTVASKRDDLYDRLILPKAENLEDARAKNEAANAAATMGDSGVGGGLSRRSSVRGMNSSSSSRPGTAETGVSSIATSRSAASTGAAAVLDVAKREKIDLVYDKRPRYVKSELLPKDRVLTLVEKLSQEELEREQRLLNAKQGLGNKSGKDYALREMQQAISAGLNLEGDADAGGAGGVDGVDTASSQLQRKQDAERRVAMRKMFLKKEEVKYGEGRIITTHNSKGKLEEPWTTTGGRYKTRPGDRTA